MQGRAEWKEGSLFSGHTESGHTLLFDTSADHASGPSPMEAVLAALCACTSVDVVSILRKKRQPLDSLTVSARAEQAPAPPRVFTRIALTYTVGGTGLSRKAVEDAVALSKGKYCSVSIMLSGTVEVSTAIEYLESPGEEQDVSPEPPQA